MAYFAWGWPKALLTGATPLDSEAIYVAQASSEYVVAVFNATIQVWSGGQHRVKLGELHRTPEAVAEEGANLRAHWCPQKRVLAVATAHNHLHQYALNVSSEALWRLPDGQEVRRVNLYLSHSIHLDYGPVRIADLGGDAKSLLVALTNGTMQVFSWQGKLRGQSNPFIAAYEGSRSRMQRARSSGLGGAPSNLGRVPSSSSDLGAAAAGAAANGLQPPSAAAMAAAAAAAAAQGGDAAAGSALLAAMAAMDLPQPTPALPAEVAVERIHYAPAARMLAVVLADGRCALCRTADSGIHPVEQLQLFRWVYKPAAPSAPAAVAAALNPTAQLLAVGLSHGRVAIYTMQSLLSVARHASFTHAGHQRSGSSGGLGGGGGLHHRTGSGNLGGAQGGGAGQPEPVRVLSLADWGYRSAVVGAATQLQWSPDGRVLAVGYAERGMAVWTPSGCRLMCSLRQAVATAAPGTSSLALVGASGSAQLAAGTPTPPGRQHADGSGGGGGAKQQQDGVQRTSIESQPGAAGSPRSKEGGGGGLWSQNSNLNPSQAPEAGVLEGGMSALAWTAHGYQLIVAEAGQAGCLHQLEFARQMHGAHRVAQSVAGAGQDEVQALQAADRVLLVSEAPQAANPALRLPPAAGDGQQGDAEAAAAAARPDLTLQHIKLPQQYIEAAYPALHAAISQDRQDVAVAGTQGMAVYSRRTRRWRLFGDATQEKGIRVQGLMWLPGGVIAAVALVDGGRGEPAAPQLLLYPQSHLDSASLLARLPLQQVPVAMDSSGWHLVLAFAPLEIKLFKVTLEGAPGPGPGPKLAARLSVVRELSIMGLGNPLQEIALIDPLTLPHADSSLRQPAGSASHLSSPLEPLPEEPRSATSTASADPSWPQLPPVATRPRTPTAEVLGSHAASDAPLQCVLLRAGGIMSKLDMQEGSEVLLSDAIERFWLPVSPAAAGSSRAGGGGGSGDVSRTGSFSAGLGGVDGPSLSASSSLAGLAHQSSDAELAATGAAAAARLEQAAGLGAGGAQRGGGQPPHVEMPWWTYGARGMQLWFPTSLSEPLTPSLRSLTSPTATGLAAAAAAAATNSTDPELEFDREVYPIGVSLAEVSIIGVMQRSVRSQVFPPQAAQSLCFHPLPESQPVLPCLLRRLLQKGRYDDALELARWHSEGPHFNRSLEWLLFTALEIDADQPRPPAAGSGGGAQAAAAAGIGSPLSAGKAARQARFNSSYSVTISEAQQGQGLASPRSADRLSAEAAAARRAGQLLVAAARLISCFPQFPEIVVSVARKTDAALWPALFAAVGSPLRLCQGLMQTDKLQSAACCLVIVEQIEGSAQAQHAALLLIQAALQASQYGLASDLLRFLVPPGLSGDALLLPEVQQAVAAGADAAAEAQRQQEAAEAAAAAEAPPPPPPPPPEQPQQQVQQQEQPGAGSWFWGLFGGSAPAAPPPTASPKQQQQEQLQTPSRQQGQQGQGQAKSPQQLEEEEDAAAAGKAWRLTAEHAWKLLDSGALREAAQLARSLAELHGGLPALLAATAGETPGAAAHMAPSAAAIASALFVAANEFSSESELDAALAAEQLLAVCLDAGCVNLGAALALLLGDQRVIQQFAAEHPAVWEDLYTLIANDVHLCGYAPVLSPLPSPMVGAGGAAAAALLLPAAAEG